MDDLPNELLEKILDFINDVKTIEAIRFVCKKFNQVGVRRWRELHNPVSLLTEQLILEFQTDVEFRIQEFPFSKFSFVNLNPENLVAVKQLLVDNAQYVTSLTFEKLSEYLKTQQEFLEFMRQLSSLVNLEELCLKTLHWDLESDEGLVRASFPKLKTLITPKIHATNKIVKYFLKGSPNLEVFETPLDVVPELVWPLLDENKSIQTIYMNANLDTHMTAGSTAILDLSQKIVEEWTNVRLRRLFIKVSCEHANLIPQAKIQMQRILDSQADYIKDFVLNGWPSTFDGGHLSLLIMRNLENLDLSCHNNRQPIVPIRGNPFPNLKSVTLRAFHESNVFRGAVLDTVEYFQLFSTLTGADGPYTRWDQVFPNLKTFRLDNIGSFGAVNFSHLEFLITHMQMRSLKSVEYRLRKMDIGKSSERIARINRIFSGFENPEELVDEAAVVEEKGGDKMENQFWASVEEKRRTCIVNMPGLKNFYFDQPINDTFAKTVLLKIPPLDLLTICSENLSLRVFCEVIGRHKSFCSIQRPKNMI